MDSLNFKPIGYFESSHKYKYDAPRQSTEDQSEAYGKLILEKGFNLEQGFKGIEGFERIWLIYKFHKNNNWKPVTNTPRATEKQGVFATRSPYRPNPIGMSCVRLVAVKSDHLIVSGFDLLDGTPILDIKPYIPHCDSFDVKNNSWIEEERLKEVVFLKKAEEQVVWLEENGVKSLRGFVIDQLTKDPINEKKKRVIVLADDCYQLSYRTWRVSFKFKKTENLCEVFKIHSGYSEEDLLDIADKYGDKDLHRHFREAF